MTIDTTDEGTFVEQQIDRPEQLIASACRMLGRLNVTHASFGHVSMRDGDAMLIKGKGPGEVGLRYTEESDIIRVSMDAEMLSGRDDLQPPSESFLHAWLYRLRPEVQSVVHMHPESAVLLTICGKGLQPIYAGYGQGVRLACEGVPVYDSSLTVNNHERGEQFAKFLGSSRAGLMRAHGATTVGDSVEDATITMLLLKELSDMTYKAHQIGEPNRLPQEEIDEMAKGMQPGRKRGSAAGRPWTMAMWRYFQALADDSTPTQ